MVVEIAPGVYDIWMHPGTGDYVSSCPWLHKLPHQNKYVCRIQDVKPGDLPGLSAFAEKSRGNRMSGVRVRPICFAAEVALSGE